VKRAYFLDLKLVQAFARVSLARNPITSFIFWIRSFHGFVARLCFDPSFRDAPYKIVKRLAVRRAGKPDLLYPHSHKVLLEPVLHLFHGMSGAKSADYHGSCSFLSICLCWNVFCFYLCFGTQLYGLGQKNFSKKYFF
jgi:hypothetical protein